MGTLTRIGMGFGMLAVVAAATGCNHDKAAAKGDVGTAPTSAGPRSDKLDGEPPAPAATAAPAAEAQADARAKGAAGAKPQASPQRGKGEAAAAAPAPVDRPGLGTTWGETRSSQITTVSFTRAETATPFTVASLFYNDEQGARAMADGAGFRRTAAGPIPVANGAFTVGLKSENGRFLSGYTAGGKDFVVGEAGNRYAVVLKNDTDFRFEAVVSVDGLDVMDGKSASFAKRGYIVDPHAELEVDGFRQSEAAVAAFRFGSVRGSYANQKHGDTRNVGVIGLALFHERGTHPVLWARADADRRRDANPFPGKFASPP